MANLKSDAPKSDAPVSRRTGETSLRGEPLNGVDRKTSVEHLESSETADPDQVLRTDGEDDSLYGDGLELEDDSRPLKGVNGKDDT